MFFIFIFYINVQMVDPNNGMTYCTCMASADVKDLSSVWLSGWCLVNFTVAFDTSSFCGCKTDVFSALSLRCLIWVALSRLDPRVPLKHTLEEPRMWWWHWKILQTHQICLVPLDWHGHGSMVPFMFLSQSISSGKSGTSTLCSGACQAAARDRWVWTACCTTGLGAKQRRERLFLMQKDVQNYIKLQSEIICISKEIKFLKRNLLWCSQACLMRQTMHLSALQASNQKLFSLLDATTPSLMKMQLHQSCARNSASNDRWGEATQLCCSSEFPVTRSLFDVCAQVHFYTFWVLCHVSLRLESIYVVSTM